MRSGLIERGTGILAVIAAIVTVASFLSAAGAFQLAVAGAALRTLVMIGLSQDMRLHTGAWRLRWFAWLMAMAEGAFLLMTVVGVPVEPHFGVEGVAAENGAVGATAQLIGFLVWLFYGVVTLAVGVRGVSAVRYRWFGIFMIAAAVAWFLVVGILAWPFIVAAALLALAWSFLKHPAAHADARA